MLLTVKLPALDRARYRHLADPDPNRNDRPWPITLTYNNRHPRRAMAVTHTHVKYQDQRSASSKAGVETDGRTRPIALPFTLTRSANASPIFHGCHGYVFLRIELTEKTHAFCYRHSSVPASAVCPAFSTFRVPLSPEITLELNYTSSVGKLLLKINVLREQVTCR